MYQQNCLFIEAAWGGTHPVGGVAVKEVLCADRAGGQISALVLLELRQVHAAVALHAVAHIPAQALAQAAQVAEGAVVYVPARLIIKQLADVAVVACHAAVAGPAVGCTTGTEMGVRTVGWRG